MSFSQRIVVPIGALQINAADEEAAARRRREVRERLLRGQEVVVTPTGEVTVKDKVRTGEPTIVVPPGKLARSFYWYERDTELLKGEKEAMRKYFPQFALEKLDDGRLSWLGVLRNNLKPNAIWQLQLVYDHNHPNNSTYGGSIKVYSILPDLEEVSRELGPDSPIPHLLRDSARQLYLCTSRPEDFRATSALSHTAASALAWAAKWIAAFELWMAGDITTSQFAGHNTI